MVVCALLLTVSPVSAQTATNTPLPTWTRTPGPWMTDEALTPTRTPSPTPFNWNPAPTPFTPNSACPAGAFDDNDLDPSWRAACSHCLAAPPTALGGFAGYPTLAVPSLSTMPAFSTFTPQPLTSTPTATGTLTSTPTNTPTATPDPAYLVNFDNGNPFTLTSLYGSITSILTTAYNSGNSARDGGASPSGGGQFLREVVVRVDIPDSRISSITFAAQGYRADSSSSEAIWALGIVHEMALGGEVSHEWLGSIRQNGTWGTGSVPDLPSGVVSAFRINIRGSSWALSDAYNAYIALDQIVVVLTSPLVPTNTPQPTGTAAPTSIPTQTPIPPSFFSLMPLADCTDPVYADFDTPAVDFDVTADGRSCYRLFPEINLSAVTIPIINVSTPAIQVQPLDFCFLFFAPRLSVAGLVIDLQLFVTVGLAMFLFRWGLFN